MNPEVKEKWVAALRSGEYKKGRKYMRKGGRYCCLGVLTDLYCKETGKDFKEMFTVVGVVDYNTSYLPDDVGTWADVSCSQVRVTLHGGMRASIDEVNDGLFGRKTFKQIADIIEEQL